MGYAHNLWETCALHTQDKATSQLNAPLPWKNVLTIPLLLHHSVLFKLPEATRYFFGYEGVVGSLHVTLGQTPRTSTDSRGEPITV